MADEKKDETNTLESIDVKSLFGTVDGKASEEKGVDTKVEPPSPGATEEDKPTDDPKELQAKLDGLTKELSRVRKGKAESGAEVQELREQLANVQGQLEVLSKGAGSKDEENRLAKYTDEQLLQGQTEWEDEVDEAKDAMRRARAENDESLMAKANKTLSTARNTLISIRKELLERTKRVGAEQAKAQNETNELVQEITSIYESTYEAFPDLKDQDSELWKAGNKAFTDHPKLMKQLGPLAEIVAVSLALSENPELLPGGGTKKVKEARKELLEEINERAEQTLIKGKGTTSKKTVPDFGAMPKGQFDALVHKLKMGG